jgi:Holliday junction resolvase RusA-like endonuclease
LTFPIEPYPRRLEAKVFRAAGRPVGKIHLHSKSLKHQKATIQLAKLQWKRPPLTGPISLHVLFLFERPKKPKHATNHIVFPDCDNLLKNLMDSLTKSGVWKDDAQVWSVCAQKKYCEGVDTPRTEVIIETEKVTLLPFPDRRRQT